MSEFPHQPPTPPLPTGEPPRPRVIAAAELLQNAREIWIDHDGMRYRLRLTRRNKLILQK
jgi:hemin uptake protein HemP